MTGSRQWQLWWRNGWLSSAKQTVKLQAGSKPSPTATSATSKVTPGSTPSYPGVQVSTSLTATVSKSSSKSTTPNYGATSRSSTPKGSKGKSRTKIVVQESSSRS